MKAAEAATLLVDGKIVEPAPGRVPTYNDIQNAITAAMPK